MLQRKRLADGIGIARGHVGYMNEPRLDDRGAADRATIHGHRAGQGDRTVVRACLREAVTDKEHGRVLRAGEARGALGDRVEDGLDVGRRCGDDLEDVAHRGLSLERLLRFIEQPHVLDRDGRLIGERLDEPDRRGREGPRFLLPQRDHALDLVAALHRHAQDRVHTELFIRPLGRFEIGVGFDVRDVDRGLVEQDARSQRLAVRT